MCLRMYWGFKKRFELFGVPPQQYIIPPSLTDIINDLQIIIRENLGSIIIAGPLGSGKTSLMFYLKHQVQEDKIEVLSAQAIGSLGYLAEQFAENVRNNETYREFWQRNYGIYVPMSGSGRTIFNRLLKGIKTDSWKREVKYLLIIDEFKPLLWARSDIRRNVIEHLAHIVNDRNTHDGRYANLMLSLIQRPDQDSTQVFDQMLTISSRKANIERKITHQ